MLKTQKLSRTEGRKITSTLTKCLDSADTLQNTEAFTTDLAREIESSERDISKYEQQSSDPTSDAMKHGIVCGGMAHQGLKQHIDQSISRLATYKALRDEIINYSRARRTWTDPNAMQVDAVHVTVNQETARQWQRPTVRQGQR